MTATTYPNPIARMQAACARMRTLNAAARRAGGAA